MNLALDILEKRGFDPRELLTRNFQLWEVFHSDSAQVRGIPNVPGDVDSIKANAKALADNALQAVRDYWGVVRVSSWYRSPELNTAIGGAPASAHLTGEAADIQFPALPPVSLVEVFKWLGGCTFPFDQVILESRFSKARQAWSVWLHVAHRTSRTNRRMLLLSPDGLRYMEWDKTDATLLRYRQILSGIA